MTARASEMPLGGINEGLRRMSSPRQNQNRKPLAAPSSQLGLNRNATQANLSLASSQVSQSAGQSN